MMELKDDAMENREYVIENFKRYYKDTMKIDEVKQFTESRNTFL